MCHKTNPQKKTGPETLWQRAGLMAAAENGILMTWRKEKGWKVFPVRPVTDAMLGTICLILVQVVISDSCSELLNTTGACSETHCCRRSRWLVRPTKLLKEMGGCKRGTPAQIQEQSSFYYSIHVKFSFYFCHRLHDFYSKGLIP